MQTTSATTDHGSTERVGAKDRLAKAAVELLRSDGVLSGFSLQAVADRAGVARGNISHHFASRRNLLRYAIARGAEAHRPVWRASVESVRFVTRQRAWIRGGSTSSSLLALLAIDGDDEFDPMPHFNDAISDLRQSVIDGDIDREHDLVALHAALVTYAHGYRIFRKSIARRLGMTSEELDERVGALTAHWLRSMTEPPVHAT